MGRHELCIKAGNLCRVARGGDPFKCSDHQLMESEWRPVLDDAIELLDSVRVTMSPALEKRVIKVIDAHSHLGNREVIKRPNLKKIRVNLAESEIR
jgi:hypothetical protein